MEQTKMRKEMWPPSYAGFLAYCHMHVANDVAAHRMFEPLKLPDKTALERSRGVGEQTLDTLKTLFDD
jgi:hypothetical protein